MRQTTTYWHKYFTKLSACPRSGEDLQKQYNQGAADVSTGIKKIADGTSQLATSVPGTLASGPVAASFYDLVADGVKGWLASK
jgi:X-X-X-Leu-X-X-Gly heptad repeat protein